jgi:hypothetical protein
MDKLLPSELGIIYHPLITVKNVRTLPAQKLATKFSHIKATPIIEGVIA